MYITMASLHNIYIWARGHARPRPHPDVCMYSLTYNSPSINKIQNTLQVRSWHYYYYIQKIRIMYVYTSVWKGNYPCLVFRGTSVDTWLASSLRPCSHGGLRLNPACRKVGKMRPPLLSRQLFLHFDFIGYYERGKPFYGTHTSCEQCTMQCTYIYNV